MRALLKLATTEFKLFLREPAAFFWVIAACIIATHEAHRIPLGKAAITTVVSLLPMAFILGITTR